MIRTFINVNEVSEKLDHNAIKVMLDAESRYRGQLFKVVNMINKRRKKIKVLLLGGPSCAGKTSTARLIKEIFEKSKHRRAIIISMDDFFVNREDTPLLPNGQKDFDSLRAVNFEQMEQCFTKLFKTGEAKFPRFNFETGLNEPDYYDLNLKDNPIIIFEGLHVLNPDLTKYLGTTGFFKMYISTLRGFKNDKGIKMSTRQVRLVRRIIRDIERRKFTPEKTFELWKNVCDAEDAYIAPYKDDVDYYIDTTHDYEIALYKTELFKIMAEKRDQLKRLSFLDLFDNTISLQREQLPETTLMWEFIDREID